MNLLIIEDEKPAARFLQRKLEKLGFTVATLLHTVEDSVAYLQNNKHPDLIFLDIQLADGLSFSIFEKVSCTSAIIFTTAYDTYAINAFKLNSIDYLLKPIDDGELETAISKYKNYFFNANVPMVEIATLKSFLASPKETLYKKRFTSKVGNQLKIIPIEAIACIYSENKATYVYTIEGRSYLIDSALEVIFADLDPKLFFKINRKCIVALHAVKEIQVYSNSRLKISLPSFSSDTTIVAREKVAEFKKWLH